ncbi:MAG: putative glycoside hydrolase [Eubacteriales bacterium]|nr:putative glycoside hydrolase [Eubacteriales bacterium]
MNNNRKHNHSRIHRTVAAVLIVAAVVVIVGAFLVFQCLSFDENGAHVIDRYGVLAMEAAGSGEPEKDEHMETTTEPEIPDEEQEDNAPAVRAAMLSANALSDAESVEKLEQLAKDGVLDTVIVNIKDEDGYLNIGVRTNQLDDVDTITEDTADELEDSIQTLHDAGVHVVGRIYCMHDQRATSQNTDLAMQYQAGGTWLDYDNTRWLDITNRDAVDYIGDIARSAVKAGCDEILLDAFTFPLRGHMDRIDFAKEPEEQADILLGAFEDIKDAVGEGISVSLTAGSVNALTELSAMATDDGIPTGNVEDLLTAADRVLVPADSVEEAAEAVESVQKLAKDAVVIPILDNISAWMEYTGDAVLEAVYNTEDVLAVLNGEKSADAIDDDDTYDDDSDEDSDDEW